MEYAKSIQEVKQSEGVRRAMEHLKENMNHMQPSTAIPFQEYLQELTRRPAMVIRNVFQVFHDMIKTYIGEGIDEYPNDPESIGFVFYDCRRLFVEGTDQPFFADRLFANRLVGLVEALKRGAQQNKIYIFKGPPGCGKSTFLNNLLMKFEEYANTEAGCRYETIWRLDRHILGGCKKVDALPVLERLAEILNAESGQAPPALESCTIDDDYIEVPCPSHDHPLLMIPKQHRRTFLDELFKDSEFRWKLLSEKEYGWVFKDTPCTICSSIYQALLDRLRDPQEVFDMIYARPYRFDRRLGEGISVFNPGDEPMKQRELSNAMLQRQIDAFLKDSIQVKYIFSQYAKTHNGIYALMDIKSHNTERLIELHNIISEGVHKVADIEENVNSLLVAVMNPEDEANIQGFQSFLDRIEYINIPYVLDLNTEVEIYRNIFGPHIERSFLPQVLRNFARVVVSSRLSTSSSGLLEWIGDPSKYRRYCDENLQLLKMEIYTGHIPSWLTEEDRKRFTAERRRRIVSESEHEGAKGISGRDSIKIFNEFYSTFGRDDKLINMSNLSNFFKKARNELLDLIPRGFLESLHRMYDYTVLQEVKESLYYYNENQIARDLKNYLFAINFEIGTVETCTFTGEKLEIKEDFLAGIEKRILGASADQERRLAFRRETQKEYTAKTLTQEILLEGKSISQTEIYKDLHERYTYNLKERVLDPLLENENFRRAIKSYNGAEFRAYDRKIRDDVTYLIKNLGRKFNYTEQGAKEVCVYVIDDDLAKRYGEEDGPQRLQ